jgi:hypothetical protein
MNDCERLSDRMPDVALHRAAWTPEEAAHLEGCAECLMEWRLVLAARALDESAPAVTDPSALPAALRRRLAVDRARRTRAGRAWAFAAAAAAAAILAAVVTGRDAGPSPGVRMVAEAEALVPLPELEGLETAQLDTLLQSLNRPAAGTSSLDPSTLDASSLDASTLDASTLDASTLGEHEDGELEQVFATWEG